MSKTIIELRYLLGTLMLSFGVVGFYVGGALELARHTGVCFCCAAGHGFATR